MVMRRLAILFIIVCFSTLFLISCGYVEDDSAVEDLEESETDEEIESTDELEEEIEVEEEKVACSVNDDCSWGEYCVEGVCLKTSDIYDTESSCEEMCNFAEVEVQTSDGDELTLSRGQGSYTAAGAVEWKLLSSADYCKGEEETPIAIELIMKNSGEIIEEKVIILELEKVSEVITHPQINSISFTLEVYDYVETCG